MAAITTIIFDYGDVLARDTIGLFEQRFGYGRLSGKSKEAYELAIKRCELGKITPKQLFKIMRRTFALKMDAEQVGQWLLKHAKPLPPLRLARRLKQQGCRVLIFSNNFRGWHRRMERSGNFTTEGIPFVNSAAIGMRKQDGRLFRFGIKKFKLDPKACLFIDDHAYNLTPARKLGFRTIRYRHDIASLKSQLKSLGIKIPPH